MLKFFSRRDYQEIADIFRLGEIRSLTYFRQGYQTPKVAVATLKGKFVIAKHNLSKKRAVVADMKIVPKVALLQEIGLLNYLKSLPVPHYFISKNGKYLESYKEYSVSVYGFIEGSQPKILTPKMTYQLGEFVGEFHRLGSNYKKPMMGRRRFYDLNPKVLSLMYRNAKRQTHPELVEVVEEIRSGIEHSRLPSGLPKGPIHVDIKPDNELFLKGKLVGVIDFGNTYEDPFIFDVGKTIMWNCVRHGKINPALMNAFLSGYTKKRKLLVRELKNLDRSILFAIYSHLWVDLYHVPIKYVPESYTLFLVRTFLPVARRLQTKLAEGHE